MHVITRKRLNDFAADHPDCKASLAQWFAGIRGRTFSDIQAIRSVFPHADKVGENEDHPLASFMDVLGTLVHDYEAHSVPDLA
jgi:mRNA interferase HigB